MKCKITESRKKQLKDEILYNLKGFFLICNLICFFIVI